MTAIDYGRVVGHISGEDLESITFIADEIRGGQPQRITLGEMYIAVDRRTKERFLLRVSNVGYGQKTEWRRESARNHNKMVSIGSFEGEHQDHSNIYQDDRDEQRFLEAHCELVGFIDYDGSFGPPKHLPSYDSPVRKISETDLDFMDKLLGDIIFGRLRSGSQVLNVPVGLYSELIPYHIGVFAKTGGGKSNVILRIVGGILETEGKIGMCLLEPHGEYKQDLIHHPFAKDNLVVFETQKGEDPYSRELRISYSDLTVTDVMISRKQMHWTEPQERFMREVEERLGNDWFRYLLETPVTAEDAYAAGLDKPPSLLKSDFPNYMEDSIKVTQSKLRRIKNAPFLRRDNNISDIKEILALLDKGKVVLIDVSGMSGEHELLVSGMLASRILGRRKYMYNTNRKGLMELPPISIVLEEAQRVLNRENDGNIFASICNEGRKFRVGLLPITQQPKNIDPTLLSQINTLFILGLSDKRDFETLSEFAAKPIEKLRQEIKALRPGEAIITSPKSPFAVPVKVDYYHDYVKALKPKKVVAPKNSSFRNMV